MKIVDMRVRTAAIPLNAQLRHNTGVHPGCFLRTIPGLGVALDEDKMKHYEQYFEAEGDYYGRFHQDPRRPDWYPIVGGM